MKNASCLDRSRQSGTRWFLKRYVSTLSADETMVVEACKQRSNDLDSDTLGYDRVRYDWN